MPPANDNFADAIAISGDSGSINGSNIGATAESGEPANNGHTVWYSFTNTDYVPLFFTTLNGTNTNPFRSLIRVFAGADVAHLTESSYLISSGATRSFNGWDVGALIAINAPGPGYSIYIRIDSLIAADTGDFTLTWGLYDPVNFTIGCSTNCGQPFGKLACIDSLEIDVTTSGTITGESYAPTLPITGTNYFSGGASLPGGIYLIKYCGGAYQYIDSGGSYPPYTVYLDDGSGAPRSVNQYILIDYYDLTSSEAITHIANLPPATDVDAAYRAYAAADLAIAAFSGTCCGNTIYHGGGKLGLMFYCDYSDTSQNVAGSPSPTFNLYRVIPVIDFVRACASWTTPGSNATCDFTVQNQNGYDWTNVTATLDAVGGVSSPTPATGLTLTKNTITAFTIPFNCSTAGVTATLRLSSPLFDDITFTIYLGPILTATTSLEATGTSGGMSYAQYLITVTNLGFWKLQYNDETITASGVEIYPSDATGATLYCASNVPLLDAADFFSVRTGSPQTGAMTVGFIEGSYHYDTITFPISVIA